MPPCEKDLLNRAVRALDRIHRRLLGIYEFSSDPHCIYRLSIKGAPRDAILPDGTELRKGDPVGILHIWGEHMPTIPPSGADFAWASRMVRILRHSGRLLAQYASGEQSLRSIAAFGNDVFFNYTPNMFRVLQRLGFAVLEDVPAVSWNQRIRIKAGRLWTWLLRRAFNRQSVSRVKPGDLQLRSIWLSRRALMEKHAENRVDFKYSR